MGYFYKHYQDARDAAWSILFDYQLTNFPINVEPIIESKKVMLYDIRPGMKTNADFIKYKDALAMLIDGLPFILYNPDAPSEQLRFTLAHELGHILLGHVAEKTNYTEYQEDQANVFASRLLMPAIVCHAEKLNTPEQIASFFGVPLSTASIRAARIAELESRCKWNTSPLERQYYELYINSKK